VSTRSALIARVREHAIRAGGAVLEPGEHIQAVMFGKTGPGFWATLLLLGVFALPFVKGYHVCVTDRRVLVFRASLMAGAVRGNPYQIVQRSEVRSLKQTTSGPWLGTTLDLGGNVMRFWSDRRFRSGAQEVYQAIGRERKPL
jgi:hypothetical protein